MDLTCDAACSTLLGGIKTLSGLEVTPHQHLPGQVWDSGLTYTKDTQSCGTGPLAHCR
jgi:hypothetical protein